MLPNAIRSLVVALVVWANSCRFGKAKPLLVHLMVGPLLDPREQVLVDELADVLLAGIGVEQARPDLGHLLADEEAGGALNSACFQMQFVYLWLPWSVLNFSAALRAHVFVHIFDKWLGKSGRLIEFLQ